MSSRKKPRGLRIKKPQVPLIEIGQAITYHEWRIKNPNWVFRGLVIAEPEWTNDGYWIVDIYIPIAWANGGTGGHHQLIWDEDKKRWESGEI
jgi:hypothetical protein